MSAQSFLDGLLGSKAYHPRSHGRPHDPTIQRELRIPKHSWKRKGDASNTATSQEPLVQVQVRPLHKDPLNAFDRNPDLMSELVSEVIKSPHFSEQDGLAAPLAAQLANILPGLVRPRRSDFSQRSPSGINWVEAADHFVCRHSHNLKFTRFTDYEHDDRIEQYLAAMKHPVLAHLAWRFRQWYQHKRLLAAIAAPPLREVANQLEATPDLPHKARRPFVMYSCHDITILGLLYGIGAHFLANDDNNSSSGKWRFWPPYGSHLIFELVRIDGKEGDKSHADSHLVRVLLNGRPVLSVDMDESKRDHWVHRGHGPEHMLRVTDFLDLVSSLEEAGGHDYGRLLGSEKE